MIEEVFKKFNIDGELIAVDKMGSGNINKTYVATVKGKNNKEKKYLVQQINTKVFTEPFKLMKNIEGVTAYRKKQMIKTGDDEHKVLEVVKTKDGKSLCYITNESDTREYYRIYEYIDHAISYDSSVDPKIVYNTGKAFGNFQKLLANYPMNKLEETIKGFHDTEERYNKLRYDMKIDSEGRTLEVAKEIVFIMMREDIYSLITSELKNGDIPYRVTHNDTKVNNVMMNEKTKDYLAVIDLDTVMPGTMLFDYGDGIRSTASSASEDETDLSKIYLVKELFEAYTDGYMSEMAPYLSYDEVSLMGESIRIITLELAIRFLNDYINGDTYFKINYDKHNLDRARNQIKLVEDIESKMDDINKYILDSYDKYRHKEMNNKVANEKVYKKVHK